MAIDTDRLSEKLRTRALDPGSRSVRISRLVGSEQEQDISEPVNCEGLGRIRHFRRSRDVDWPINPLPLDPALRALGLDEASTLRAQVFQNAVCNWRCWYCFVPFDLLSGHSDRSEMVSIERLVDLYVTEPNHPQVIDLSGGQPDLAPEWVPWMMLELQRRGLDNQTYLWSDDNLSNDYFWRFLTPADLDLILSYPNYGRACCFKGFDEASFAFNTSAHPDLFERQFELMARFLSLGIDLYVYVTLTTPTTRGLGEAMSRFMDRLQRLSPMLPLRTVPLKIDVFSPVASRMNPERTRAIELQWAAVEAWESEIEQRFNRNERSSSVVDVEIGGPA